MSDLSPRLVDYLRSLVEDRRTKCAAGAAAQELARDHGIGRMRGKTVYYEPKDHNAAASLLTSRGYPLERTARGGLRSDSAPGGSEKTGAAAVLANYVAVIPLHMPLRVPSGARFLAADWRELDASTFEAVLEVENLEAFVTLSSYRWLHELFVVERPTLALYRGDPRTFNTGAPAQLVRACGKPILGFYDFDPEGLCMAASEPNLQALCLPKEEVLVSAVRRYRREHLWVNQVQHRRSQLEALPEGPVRTAWRLMKELQCGLPQENFPR